MRTIAADVENRLSHGMFGVLLVSLSTRSLTAESFVVCSFGTVVINICRLSGVLYLM